MSHYVPEIARLATRVLRLARHVGVHLEIRTEPLKPLAMGHYTHRVYARPAHARNLPDDGPQPPWSRNALRIALEVATTAELGSMFGKDRPPVLGVAQQLLAEALRQKDGNPELYEALLEGVNLAVDSVDNAGRAKVATCIGCGCHDLHACENGCEWLAVDREKRKGVCSCCPEHLAAFEEPASMDDLRALLREVSQCFTRDDALPDGLLSRIDAALGAPCETPKESAEEAIRTALSTASATQRSAG